MLYAVVAMQNEADTLRSAAKILKERTLYGKRALEGNAFGHDLGMVLCGVGKTNAAAGTMLALTLGAGKILNFGVAGGIVPEAKLGSLWQVERAVQYDFDLHAVNGTPVGTLNEYEIRHNTSLGPGRRIASAGLGIPGWAARSPGNSPVWRRSCSQAPGTGCRWRR